MISRRMIAVMPILLVAGILAQVVLLTLAIVLYIPALIYPSMLDGCYRWVTRGMGRIMARAIIPRRKQAVASQ